MPLKHIRRFFRYDRIGYLYVLPAFIYMLVFIGYPIVSNFILSFQDVTVSTLISREKPFIGIENYIALFQDEVLIKSIINTFIFSLGCLIVQFIIGFLLALLFYRKFSLAKPIRGLLMIPWMIPLTVTALMFKFMFGTDVGIINQFLHYINVIDESIPWLTQPTTAMIAVIITNIWVGIPFNMLLLSTGLSIIPESLYESAAIDGANKYQAFWKITLPILKPTIDSVLLLGFIYTFKVFDLVYVMTQGGPVNSTHLLSTYSYKLSFTLFQYSQGASVANILFLLLLIVSFFYLKYIYTDDGVF